MTVYVEYVVLDNLALDFFILLLSSLTLKYNVKIWRLVISAAAGAACAVVSVYVRGVWLILLKGATLVVMCAVSVGFGKRLFWFAVMTVVYTFVTGGAIVGLFNLFGVEYLSDGAYRTRVPLFVYVLGVAAVAFLCYSVYAYLGRLKKIAPHMVTVKLILDKVYTLSAFCDSGNTVCQDGVPVCFAVKKFAGLSDCFATKMMQGQTTVVTVSTLTGTKQTIAVAAQIELDGVRSSVLLALPAEKCNAPYNLLLNGCFCK